jgi:hypothetical protein
VTSWASTCAASSSGTGCTRTRASTCSSPGSCSSRLIALELPDAELWLSGGVLGSLFHEHVSYYTAAALGALVRAAGFDPVALEHRHTDLFLVARNTTRRAIRPAAGGRSPQVDSSRDLLLSYARSTADKRRDFARLAAETRRAGGRVVLCGAGVHSSSMVAAFALGSGDVDAIVDDNPAVQGKVLPNLDLEILPPSVLCDARPTDAVVVSGFSFQEEMVARLARLGTRARVFGLYPRVGEVAPGRLAAAEPVAAVS